MRPRENLILVIGFPTAGPCRDSISPRVTIDLLEQTEVERALWLPVVGPGSTSHPGVPPGNSQIGKVPPTFHLFDKLVWFRQHCQARDCFRQ